MQDIINQVTDLATAARECWEELWPSWKRISGHPHPKGLPSEDACIPSSFALCRVLQVHTEAWDWKVVGGRPTKRTPRGGFLARGKGGPHLWVQGRRGREVITADITSDQFGGLPVLVCAGIPPTHTANHTSKLLQRFKANESFHVSLWVAALSLALPHSSD